MILTNLTKLWICRSKKTKKDGEYTATWTFIKNVFMNLQQDLNELDRNAAGEIDYSIYKARTDIELNLIVGDGVSMSDNREKPDYTIKSFNKVGKTTVYTLAKYNGD